MSSPLGAVRIFLLGSVCAIQSGMGAVFHCPLLTAAFLAGDVTMPLYALFLAYTNDSLSPEDMPAASGRLAHTIGLGT